MYRAVPRYEGSPIIRETHPVHARPPKHMLSSLTETKSPAATSFIFWMVSEHRPEFRIESHTPLPQVTSVTGGKSAPPSHAAQETVIARAIARVITLRCCLTGLRISCDAAICQLLDTQLLIELARLTTQGPSFGNRGCQLHALVRRRLCLISWKLYTNSRLSSSD